MNPNKNKYKGNFSRYITVKLLKIKYKEIILYVFQNDKTFKAVKIRISGDFLIATIEDRENNIP